MHIGKRIYWAVTLVAVLALASAAVTITARMTLAGGSGSTPQACDHQDSGDAPDANEAPGQADAPDANEAPDQADAPDANEAPGQAEAPDATNEAPGQNEAPDANEAPGQNEADCADNGDGSEVQAPAGQLDDGKDLLPQAAITVDQADAAARGAATGDLGEVDLEQYQGKLVFNVDIGDKDVKVDAASGAVLATNNSD